MNVRLLGKGAVLAAAWLAFAGCSQVKLVERDEPYKGTDVVQPDFIVVHPVVVMPEEARKLQKGKAPSEHVPTAEEMRMGNEFASKLQAELVSAINAAGIRAYAAGNAPEQTFKTGIFQGYFMQGAMSSPTRSVGFQLKDSHIGIRSIFNIREVPVHAVTVDVKTRLSGGTTEGRVDRITNAEAKAVAEKIVDELVVPAYKKRGWLN